jgi:hypothetical protein
MLQLVQTVALRWTVHHRTAIEPPPELELNPSGLHRLLTIRSLHGDFDRYYRRFNHEDAKLTCLCGRNKSPEHLALCPRHTVPLASGHSGPCNPPQVAWKPSNTYNVSNRMNSQNSYGSRSPTRKYTPSKGRLRTACTPSPLLLPIFLLFTQTLASPLSLATLLSITTTG